MEGAISKLKARLMTRGFPQIRNIEYIHLSSPCPSSASVTLVLAVANEKGITLYLFDVHQSNIRASLGEEVYMKLRNCPMVVVFKEDAKFDRTIYG